MRSQIVPVSTLTPDTLTHAARALEQGALAVFATDTVYGLGTGALCASSIRQIYTLKQRPATQPLQLLAADTGAVCRWAQLAPAAQQLARAYWPGALTLILPPTPAGQPLLRGAKGLGFRVPDEPFLQQLLARMNQPLCSTSANLHGQPVLTEEQTVVETFSGRVDFIFTKGTLSPTPSSVVDFTPAAPRLLREGALTKTALEQTGGIVLGGL